MRLSTKLARLWRPYSSGSRPKILTIKPAAVERLRELSQGPTPKLIRIGVKSRGCSGLSYDLQYVSSKASFDEEVVQDGNYEFDLDSLNLFRSESLGRFQGTTFFDRVRDGFQGGRHKLSVYIQQPQHQRDVRLWT